MSYYFNTDFGGVRPVDKMWMTLLGNETAIVDNITQNLETVGVGWPVQPKVTYPYP